MHSASGTKIGNFGRVAHTLPRKEKPSVKSGPAPQGYVEEEMQIWLEALEGVGTAASTNASFTGYGGDGE